MPLSPGDKLGPYEILAPLGAGGMGEVYRARDTKLNRDVALKVLSEALSQDSDYMARFQREAQVLASLNHPNIAQIYGLEQDAIVMELVEGEEPHGPLPLEAALKIAKQIAEALEAAHEKGIVHRDLKPANIKIKPDGTVKVLDFGLAKAALPNSSTSNVSSPTLTIHATQVGVILGTAAYMAPEQAAGKPVDRRADIWSFGVVLWELLAGKRLFDGETISHTLASVLKDSIRFDIEQAPPPIRQLLARCLDRNAKDRLRDIGEARVAIERYLGNPSADLPKATAAHPTSRWWIAAVAALSLALIAVSLVHFRETPPEAATVRSSLLPPDNAPFDFTNGFGLPTVSPNGRRIVFGVRTADAKTSLWVRPLDALTAQPLAGTEGASFPFWSPDSRFIAFFADNKLKKIDASGGPAIPLADAPAARGGSWSSQGVILFTRNAGTGGSPLQRVSASGGAAMPLPGAIGRLPWFLPDGRHFLYQDLRPDPRRASDRRLTIMLNFLDGGEARKLLEADTNAIYAEGHLLFVRAGTLMAQRFDTKRLETTGEALPIAEGIEGVLNTRTAGVFSASETGLLAFRAGETQPGAVLTWFDRAGARGATIGEPASFGPASELSPDQKSLAAEIGSFGFLNIWIYDLTRGLRTRLTLDSVSSRYPVWSPDGRSVAFGSRRKEHFDLYRKPADGSGAEELLYAGDSDIIPVSWSPDGKFLLYEKNNGKDFDLWALPLTPDPPGGARNPFPVGQTPFNESNGQFSPDGQWVAYQSNESGRYEIYVTPFPPGVGGRRQISNTGGTQANWRKDGKEIFYDGLDRRLMAAEIAIKGRAVEVGQVRPLFLNPAGIGLGSNSPSYKVTADGQRFLIPVAAGEKTAEPLTLIQNWAAGLKK